jgi:hypothetical protein
MGKDRLFGKAKKDTTIFNVTDAIDYQKKRKKGCKNYDGRPS